ncbi:unnamed protein product [Symbiodinium necroappetens]|uniref:Uncharacterized protein n=1 Tax=Symbiodinium necroappetens TaxID=1628268 RepID=A0A813A1Q7_9DINO|nr:unnamed protein product [Symbiodinium necroappetens]
MVALKIPSTQLHDFCDGMQFPKADAWKKKEVMGMFTSKKISPGDFKPAASTCLCLYPLLRLFFMSKPDILARMTEEARSCPNLCAVLDYLVLGSGDSEVSHDHAPAPDAEEIPASVAHEIWRSRSHFHKVFGIFDQMCIRGPEVPDQVGDDRVLVAP